MFEKIGKWLDENREYGLTFFYAYDPITQKPSITLFMAYLSFILSLVASVAILFNPNLVVSALAIYGFNFGMVIFYLVRQINKAKFDGRSFEISNENKEK